MTIELNKKTFKRLVQLYLLTIPLMIIVTEAELTIGPWMALYDQFDKIVEANIDRVLSDDVRVLITGAIVLLHLVGMFGLLRFRKWGRPVFFWPIVLLFVLDVFFGTPTFFSPLSNVIYYIDAALFGMILLLAYSRSHGDIWLQPTGEQLEAAK
jgi:hypothetical protein